MAIRRRLNLLKDVAPLARISTEPEHLVQLQTTIEKATHRILSLADNWDGEGSEPYEAATFERAAEFLTSNATRLWNMYSTVMDIPKILPGPNGSIDIHWEVDDHELLVTIPPDPADPITYYGDSPRSTTKGTLQTTADAEWLLLWLAKY